LREGGLGGERPTSGGAAGALPHEATPAPSGRHYVLPPVALFIWARTSPEATGNGPHPPGFPF
jgi:hypothetical protein